MKDRSLADRLQPLLSAMFEGQLSDAQIAELRGILGSDPEARRQYVRQVNTHAMLQWINTPPDAESKQESFIPPIILDLSPAAQPSLFGSPFSAGSFVFSYLVAAVLVGVALLVGWAWPISGKSQVAYRPPAQVSAVAEPIGARPVGQSVGRITDMLDCRFADGADRASLQDGVPLGRKFVLLSGLMQIAYDTGATVILQGPCRYEIQSPAGGFLSLGKLTASVESRESSVESSGSQRDSSRLSTPHSRIFTVRTPTAVVTDLSTEFGVEVGPAGDTLSHVFRGAVSVRLVGGHDVPSDVVLHESESARTQMRGAAGLRLIVRGVSADPRSFVRLITASTVLDLLDIVAGGNGRGHCRERGIDPSTGSEDPAFVIGYGDSQRRYRPVTWNPMIDGVFIPTGKAEAVQIDSSGRTFDGFPRTNGKAFGSIWARSADVRRPDLAGDTRYWIYAMGRGEPFMPEGRGLLCLHPNAGITFNLEAMRRAYPTAAPAEFRAVLGMGDARRPGTRVTGLADVWVLVDGRLRLRRAALSADDGPVPIRVPLGRNDRFLTLASTTPGPGSWVVFGDPVLQVRSP
jgi:hypothetical protein